MMTPALLIFDCDGVLAATERAGHRVAFNQMFDELSIPLHWSNDEYAALVSIGGGKERLASVLTPALREQLGLPEDEEVRKQEVARWLGVKTRRYTELVTAGALPGRPGVKRLIGEADRSGWTVAVCSTSARESVLAVLQHVIGPELATRVHIFAGDIVARKKPAPDIYLYALDSLGFGPHNAVVVEDSGIGCRAAVGAGLATVITVSAYTGGDDFTGATMVLSDLGEPGAAATVLADPWGVKVGEYVDLGVLNKVLESRQG